MAGCCEHANEPCGSIKDGEFDQLSVLFISFSWTTLLCGVN
jgi:hypothetical protein